MPNDLTPPVLLLNRHVIEHVKDPVNFLASALKLSEKISALAVETPSVEWILRNNAYFDFYYEHCSIFTDFALKTLLEKLGWNRNRVKRLFGGQYLLGTASADLEIFVENKEEDRADYGDLFKNFSEGEKNFRANWKKDLNIMRERGEKIALWGGSSKGVIFSSLFGGAEIFFAAIDINPLKQGNFLPLSALPVISPVEAKNSGVDRIIVMNPNYFNEIKNICAEIDFRPEFSVV